MLETFMTSGGDSPSVTGFSSSLMILAVAFAVFAIGAAFVIYRLRAEAKRSL